MLLGSNVFPATITWKGESHQLGDLVRYAFQKSGLTKDAWNSMSELERDHRLVDAYYEVR